MRKKLVSFLLLCYSIAAFSQVPPGQSESGGRGGTGSTVEEMKYIGDDLVVYSDHSAPRYGVFQEKGKFGAKRNDTIIIKPVYDYIDFMNHTFRTKKDNLFGIIDYNGKVIIETKYDSIGSSEKCYIVKKSGKYGTVDFSGNSIVPVKHDKIVYSNSISKITLIKRDNMQLQLLLNNKAADFLFDNIVFYNETAIVSKDGRYGLIAEGKLICDIIYDNISADGKKREPAHNINKTLEKNKYFNSNMFLNIFIIEKDKKLGVIDKDIIVYPAVMDKISKPSRNIIIVEKDKLKGAYLPGIQRKLEVIYQDIYCDGGQFIELKKDNLSAMVDYKLNEILPLEYDDIQIQGFNSGFKISKHKKQGWADNKGVILITPVYDEIEDFNLLLSGAFKKLFKVKADNAYGVIDVSNNIILPLQFESIFERNDYLGGRTKEGKLGLYRPDGSVILKPEFDFIAESVGEQSKLLYAGRNGVNTIINKKGEIIFENSIKKIGYLHDNLDLVFPTADSGKLYLLLQDVNNKFGVYDERSETLCIPMVYSKISQKFQSDGKCYFIARKNNKTGVIDNNNNTIIPFEYDDISFNLLNQYTESRLIFPAAKNNKFGLITDKNEIVVPFSYQDIQKVSLTKNLFKAKSNAKFKLINEKGISVSPQSFDEIGNFEEDKALVFNKGIMKMIDKNGVISSSDEDGTYHAGYKTFDALKLAFIAALESPKDDLLLEFCTKISPSEHIRHYLKVNVFDKTSVEFGPDQEAIAKQYYKELSDFKQYEWNRNEYNKSSLTNVDDYTVYDNNGLVTNQRAKDPAFGNARLVERLLRNAIKINGFWISSYFMKRQFRID